ncbi:hypothetical protein KJ966_24705 [bacterium]|nr:hypothetical protein [bacterium]
MEFSKEIWQEEKRRRLSSDTTFQFKKSKGGFAKGICPECGEPTVWVNDTLYIAKCNHKRSCGWNKLVKELYPDMYTYLCEQHAPDPTDPLGQAKAYISQQRHLDLNLMAGLYTQETAKCKSDNKYYQTVRIYLDAEKKRYWERFINCSQDHNFSFGGVRKEDGSIFKGDAWSQITDFSNIKEIYIVEAIFCANSLNEYFYKSEEKHKTCVASFTSNNLPSNFIEQHKGKGIKWFVGLDNDPEDKNGRKAGLAGAKKIVTHLRELGEEAEYMFPPFRMDWNDLHKKGYLSEKVFEKSLWRGKLLTADTYKEYGYFLSLKNRYQNFAFDFNNVLYTWEPDDRLSEAINGLEDPTEEDLISTTTSLVKIKPISNFSLSFLYAQRNLGDNSTSYFFEGRLSNNGKKTKISIDSSEITSKDAFKKTMARECPGALFYGSAFWLDMLLTEWFRKELNVVKILPWGGYDSDSDCYVFNEVAYDQEGRCFLPTNHEYFNISDKIKMKTAFEEKLYYNTSFKTDWFVDYYKSFGNRGIASLSFFLASLFAEQFRRERKSFAFLAAVGQPGTGKSTMVEFLWKLLGRDEYEGVPLAKASSNVGFFRFMEQVANLPTVFLEDDETRRQNMKFNLEDFKASYNGRIMRVTGKKTQGNETNLPKFRSAIVVVQNPVVDGSTALRERFIQIAFNKKGFSEETRLAARRVESYKVEEVCGFRHYFLSRRIEVFEELLKFYDIGFKQLEQRSNSHPNGPLVNNRITLNHALIIAGARILQKHIKEFSDDHYKEFFDFVLDLAVSRQEQVAEDSHIVQLFFETIEDIERGDQVMPENTGFDSEENYQGTRLNHSTNPDAFLAINLTQFFQECGRRSIRHFGDAKELKVSLMESRKYKFIEKNKMIHSPVLNKSLRCWVFEKPI